MGKKRFICGLLIFVLLFGLIGCGQPGSGGPAQGKGGAPTEAVTYSEEAEAADTRAIETPVDDVGTEEAGNDAGSEEIAADEKPEEASKIDENGSYDSAEEVSLYLVTYHKLPGNYITKGEARKLGWQGGSLEDFAPGKCIGGDTFGNREGTLPRGHKYRECDIDTLGKNKRGAKRLIYSEDFEVYYTEDHYESFTQLY